jgi:hypothetical protein
MADEIESECKLLEKKYRTQKTYRHVVKNLNKDRQTSSIIFKLGEYRV